MSTSKLQDQSIFDIQSNVAIAVFHLLFPSQLSWMGRADEWEGS